MPKASASKTQQPQLVKAFARDLHLAPRKLRLVTNLVKNMNAVDAMVQLQHTNKKGSPIIIKLIQSAIANAKNNFSMEPEQLYIKSISADMGKVMKRYFPRARGSAFVIRRKMSHVNIVLEQRKTGKAAKSRMTVFNKLKADTAKTESVDPSRQARTAADQQTAVHEKPAKDLTKKSQVFKTDEEKKMSKVANKRRLFNRKTGE